MDKFTYLISDNFYYKIGRSVNPEERLNAIRTGNPNCTLLFYGMGRTEKQLHDIFKPFRIKREWFKLRIKDVELIQRLLNGNETPSDLLRCANLRADGRLEKEYVEYVFSFGKYKGEKISTMKNDKQVAYLKWIQTWPKIEITHSRLIRAVNRHLNKTLKQKGVTE